MIPKECKWLAKVDFPIAVVSGHSARDKSTPEGYPSTLHLWWACQPLALTANEKRTVEGRRDCYWLYVVTRCEGSTGAKLIPVRDPAQLEWSEVRKIDHYALPLEALGAHA